MKIGIIGSRGIPNHHGGFEQFAEHFAVFLAEKGHQTLVYNSSKHPYKENRYKGVKIVHCTDPEDKIGTTGQFIYDLNCILDARKQDFDILLQLGYTSSSIWYKLLPKNCVVITNMDGLEWKRAKYSTFVKRFLQVAERLAVKSSDHLIADSLGIQAYLKNKYQADSKYIAYGANLFSFPEVKILKKYHLNAYNYNMLIARMEPENNIETILDGVAMAKKKTPFLVIGKWKANQFGRYLKEKFSNNPTIFFLGGIYNTNHLNNLRYFSNLYFHGHSVGGTNPSLLEAMASNALIVAHENEFNKTILRKNAFYFKDSKQVKKAIDCIEKKLHFPLLSRNTERIVNDFSWEKINLDYMKFMIMAQKKN